LLQLAAATCALASRQQLGEPDPARRCCHHQQQLLPSWQQHQAACLSNTCTAATSGSSSSFSTSRAILPFEQPHVLLLQSLFD
jgi:hypothetical protein